MSYCRFYDSDAYIYEHVGGFIECCACSVIEPEEGEILSFYHANTAREMLIHIDEHIARGDYIPRSAIERIKADNPDLDKQIERYDANSR